MYRGPLRTIPPPHTIPLKTGQIFGPGFQKKRATIPPKDRQKNFRPPSAAENSSLFSLEKHKFSSLFSKFSPAALSGFPAGQNQWFLSSKRGQTINFNRFRCVSAKKVKFFSKIMKNKQKKIAKSVPNFLLFCPAGKLIEKKFQHMRRKQPLSPPLKTGKILKNSLFRGGIVRRQPLYILHFAQKRVRKITFFRNNDELQKHQSEQNKIAIKNLIV